MSPNYERPLLARHVHCGSLTLSLQGLQCQILIISSRKFQININIFGICSCRNGEGFEEWKEECNTKKWIINQTQGHLQNTTISIPKYNNIHSKIQQYTFQSTTIYIKHTIVYFSLFKNAIQIIIFGAHLYDCILWRSLC